MNRILRFLFLVGCLSAFVFAFAQSDKADNALSDNKALLKQTALWQLDKSPALAARLALNLFDLAHEQMDTLYQLTALQIIGEAYYEMGDPEKSKYYFLKQSELADDFGNLKLIAQSYNNLGIIFSAEKNYDRALSYYQQSLALKNQMGSDYEGQATTLSNIGIIYFRKMDYKKAREFYSRALSYAAPLKDYEGICTYSLNLAEVEWLLGNDELAIRMLKTNIVLCDSIENNIIQQENYALLASVYASSDSFRQAYEAKSKSEHLLLGLLSSDAANELNNVEAVVTRNMYDREYRMLAKQHEARRVFLFYLGSALLLLFFSLVYIFRQLRYKTRLNNLLRAKNQKITTQTHSLTLANQQLERLSLVASKTTNSVIIFDKDGNLEWVNSAFEQILNISKDEFICRYGRNIRQASLHPDIEGIINRAVKNKKSEVYFCETKTRDNRKLWFQTTLTPVFDSNGQMTCIVVLDVDITDIKDAEERIAQHQRDLTDSIRYAQRIQNSLLQPEEAFESYFTGLFLFNLPKDIVSGDFYFIERFNNLIFIVLADCTGHGVPGAFMSVVGISLLNDVLKSNMLLEEEQHITPAQILEQLRHRLIAFLRQSETETKDSMDLALCIYNTGTKTLQYSGANRPLVIVRQQENGCKIIEQKPTKSTVGYSQFVQLPFSNHTMELEKNDTCYLFSDGIVDQFGGGGPKTGKYLKKRFYNFLARSAHLSMTEQKSKLEKEFHDWKNGCLEKGAAVDQTDDVLVIGFRLPV